MIFVDIIIFLVVGLVFIQGLIRLFKISTYERHRLGLLFSVSYICILIFGTVSYILDNQKHKMNLSFLQYINNGPITENFWKTVLVGLGSGITFGIIDNVGLWFGMDALDPILPKGSLTKAGFGNVYADSLSAFLATFAGKIISTITNTNSTPLWADALGTAFGCLIGLALCRLLTNRS